MKGVIIFLAAVSKNGVIGCDGKMPWHYTADITRFKNITMGKTVVMGRKTWDSLPIKPLPGRENIVISRSSDLTLDGATVYDDFTKVIYHNNSNEIFVIGGSEIFKSYMDYADILDITHIDQEYEGDVYFPEIDPNVWKVMTEMKCGGHLRFTIYSRK